MFYAVGRSLVIGLTSALALIGSASAAMVMPDFANVPTGWNTDRYDPHAFSNLGTYQGKTNVLGIEINSAEGYANRTGGFQNIFYNTQGKQQALSGANVGSVLAASLFIESDWLNAANGNVRSDMWGVVSNAGNSVTDYPIIGFTNFGGAPRLRVFDANVGGDGWVNIATVTQGNDWIDFSMELTATSIVYSIDGNVVYTDNTIGGDHFSAVIMQAYNFYDSVSPALAGALGRDYVAHWANIGADVVPEPATLLLLTGGLLAAASTRRRVR